MNENKKFEHEIDPDLLAEIEEWEKADHDEPAEYYFSNPDPYLKPQPRYHIVKDIGIIQSILPIKR